MSKFRRLLIVLVAVMAPTSAFAQEQQFVRQKDVGSGTSLAVGTPTAITGCSAVAINTAATCGGATGFSVAGYNFLTLDINYTWAAGTSITFNLECSNDGGTTWYVKQGTSLAAGVDTATKLIPTKATGNASQKFEYSFVVNAGRCKVTNLIVAGGNGSDTATVYGTLAVTPAF